VETLRTKIERMTIAPFSGGTVEVQRGAGTLTAKRLFVLFVILDQDN